MARQNSCMPAPDRSHAMRAVCLLSRMVIPCLCGPSVRLRLSDDAEGAPAIRNRVMIRIPGRTVRHRLDLPGDRAAAFDLDRAVADFAADPAGGADRQAVFHHEVAVEATGDIGRFDLSVTLEDTGVGDFDGADVRESSLHPALD